MRRNAEPSSLLLARQETCCQCGMSRSEWVGTGYKKEGFMYCCERCAEETGCSCYEAARLAPRDHRLKSKAAPRIVTPRGGPRP